MKKIFLVVAAVVFSSTLIAQEKCIVLDSAKVSTVKSGKSIREIGKDITVISKGTIEKSGSKTLSQLLNEQAGVIVTGALNNLGGVQTLSIRGASSGRTLLLLDGIPITDASMINGEMDLNLFSLDEIERIEICRGAQSTIYGSDAIGGAVNIITVKKNLQKPINASATVSYGSLNTFKGNAQLYGRIGRLTYTTRYSKLKTDGFSAAHDSVGNKDFDKDGYNGNTFNAGVQYQLSKAFTLKTFLQASDYKSDIDASVFKDDKDFTINNKLLAAGAGIEYNQDIFHFIANYQYAEIARSYLNDSADISGFSIFERNKYNARSQFAEMFGNISPTKWFTLLVGSDYRWNTMDQKYLSISSYGPYNADFDSSLHQTSVYGSVFFNSLDKKLNIEMGGRHNMHSRYGNNQTYSINGSYQVFTRTRLFGSYSTAFKSPSIYQLYDGFVGNLELKAEESKNIELGLEQTLSNLYAKVVFFNRAIDNGIDYNYMTNKYFNYIHQKVNGFEFSFQYKPISSILLNANYTFLNGKETTQSRLNFNDTTYKYLLRRPQHHINISLGYDITSKLFASISGKYVSSRYDVGGFKKADVHLNGYFLLQGYAAYKVFNSLKLFTDIQNITNQKFFDVWGYNSIPLLVNVGVNIKL